MNNNLQFILGHHPWRASAKHSGIVEKVLACGDVGKVLYPSPWTQVSPFDQTLSPSFRTFLMDDPKASVEYQKLC